MNLPENIQNRIMPEPMSGCWLWLGELTKDGYGRLKENRKNIRAHRRVYTAIKGEIGEGLDLDHKCRVRCCVNPVHLEPVTNLENHKRGIFATRSHCSQGHAYTPENTIITKKQRVCRTCKNERNAAYKRKVRLSRKK